MAFIKVDNIVINTTYIAAAKLEERDSSGEERVSLLIAIPALPLFDQEANCNAVYHYEWIDFTGNSAIALRDYFSSFNNVIDLLPKSHELSTNSTKNN